MIRKLPVCFPLLFILLLHASSHAQSQIKDIPALFHSIGSKAQVLHLKKNGIKIPSGGHLQGIQRVSDTMMVMTGSSATYSYYLMANSSQLTAIQKISDPPLRHAGGCQVVGSELITGIEDNQAKNRSEVVLISLLDSTTRQKVNHMIYRSGQYKRSTAGAVGMTQRGDRAIIAVGAWDSRDIDFYSSRIDRPQFDSLTTFHAPEDSAWCSYQSVNLMSDRSEQLYLFGFGRHKGRNRADMYQLKLLKEGAVLTLIATRYFQCKGGAGFRFGAGISETDAGKLAIYTCSRNVGAQTIVNVFK